MRGFETSASKQCIFRILTASIQGNGRSRAWTALSHCGMAKIWRVRLLPVRQPCNRVPNPKAHPQLPSPASVVSDALTILSANWSDAKSSGSYGSRNNPQNTTINAAILTGVVYTTGTDSSTFSGGVHNLPRLLENWTGYTLTLNTSIVNLYNSVSATNQFQVPGIYYNAPNRQFSFDVNFTDPKKQPPGTPMLGVMQRNQWASPPPNNTTYAGP